MTVRAPIPLLWAILPAVLMLMAFAPAKAPPAARPAAAPAEVYDPLDPASLITVLAGMDAKAQVAGKTADGVVLKVATPTSFTFGVQFSGCDAQARKCKAMAFTTASSSFKPTLAQFNGYNQTSLTCRVWQDKGGGANVMYSTLLSPRDTAAEARTHIAAWQGCLASFGEFLKDPSAYLASAP
jgi:hypothetical protein